MSSQIELMRGKLKEVDNLLTLKERLLNTIKQSEQRLKDVDRTINRILSTTVISATAGPSRHKQNLKHYIIRAMAPGAHMSASEVAKKVQLLGYITRSKTFSKQIQTFLSAQKDIKRVRRGIYTRVNGKLKDQITLGQN